MNLKCKIRFSYQMANFYLFQYILDLKTKQNNCVFLIVLKVVGYQIGMFYYYYYYCKPNCFIEILSSSNFKQKKKTNLKNSMTNNWQNKNE